MKFARENLEKTTAQALWYNNGYNCGTLCLKP